MRKTVSIIVGVCILLLGISLLINYMKSPKRVSIGELVKNPQRYNGEYLIVEGYFNEQNGTADKREIFPGLTLYADLPVFGQVSVEALPPIEQRYRCFNLYLQPPYEVNKNWAVITEKSWVSVFSNMAEANNWATMHGGTAIEFDDADWFDRPDGEELSSIDIDGTDREVAFRGYMGKRTLAGTWRSRFGELKYFYFDLDRKSVVSLK